MEGPSLVGSVTLVDTYTRLRVHVSLTGGMISEEDIVRVLPVLAPLRVLFPKGPDDWINREVEPVRVRSRFLPLCIAFPAVWLQKIEARSLICILSFCR